MPFVVRSDSENEAELVFLSPEEEPTRPDPQDQGASPVLRQSNRKRKSVTAFEDMTKNSGSKKKKNSPDPASKNMPKLPRTPQAGQDQEAQAEKQSAQASQPSKEGRTALIEALLLGMEGRLGSKIDSTNRKVDRALTMVEDLELRVAEGETALERKLEEVEGRIQTSVAGQVKDMVLNQLREAGFDPELTAGALSTLQASRYILSGPPGPLILSNEIHVNLPTYLLQATRLNKDSTYASAAANPAVSAGGRVDGPGRPMLQQDRAGGEFLELQEVVEVVTG